jgi:hypothetical protein
VPIISEMNKNAGPTTGKIPIADNNGNVKVSDRSDSTEPGRTNEINKVNRKQTRAMTERSFRISVSCRDDSDGFVNAAMETTC